MAKEPRRGTLFNFSAVSGVTVRAVNLNPLSSKSKAPEASPEEIAEVIINTFDEWQNDKDGRWCYLSPERLNYPDDAADEARVSALTAELEAGRAIPEVLVFENEGEFYLSSGLESALAYSFSMSSFIPVKLVKGSTEGKSFVKMKNSL